jgi:hypothetical protein
MSERRELQYSKAVYDRRLYIIISSNLLYNIFFVHIEIDLAYDGKRKTGSELYGRCKNTTLCVSETEAKATPPP